MVKYYLLKTPLLFKFNQIYLKLQTAVTKGYKMYIEIHNLDINQEAIYFKLNSAFSLESEDGKSKKIKGIYAIYKDDICLYVGQSKNIASRIATHIRGKYKNFSNIFIWNVENIGFSDFINRDNASQKSILANCEQYIMTKLHPTENLLINMDKEVPLDEQPYIDFEIDSCYTIEKKDSYIVITDEYSRTVENINLSIDYLDFINEIDKKTWKSVIKAISGSDIRIFGEMGVKNEA